MIKKNVDNKRAAIIIFAVYAVILIILLLGRTPKDERTIELTPIKTISEYVVGFVKRGWMFKFFAVVNLLGNIVMFIPLGFFPYIIWKKMRKFWICFLVNAGVIIAIEAIQYVTRLGSADIDDFILNSVGVIIGYWIGKAVIKNCNKEL